MTADPLRAALQELAREVARADIRLIVGGGYGLVLRARHLAETGARTRHPSVPAIRATEDIDCFLSVQVITNGTRTAAIRNALDVLQYEVIVPNLQFRKRISLNRQHRDVKVDFLAGPVPAEEQAKVRVKDMRMRPRGTGGLHAYITPEAFTIERFPLAIEVSDGGEPLHVHLPYPFSYLLLKLFALRDRLHHAEGSKHADAGKYHALDLYTIWAMMTEPEWDEALQLRDEHRGNARLDELVQSSPHCSAPGSFQAPRPSATRESGREYDWSRTM